MVGGFLAKYTETFTSLALSLSRWSLFKMAVHDEEIFECFDKSGIEKLTFILKQFKIFESNKKSLFFLFSKQV